MTLVQLDRKVTPEQLLLMPDSSSLELVDGRLVKKNTSVVSSLVEGTVLYRLQNFLNAHSVGAVFPQSLGYRCFLDDLSRVRKPDVTFVRLDRLNALPNPDPEYMPIAPDLAVEVVSAGDTVYELDRKVREYLKAGSALVWVMDPEARLVVVHPAGGRPAILTEGDTITAEGVLPGFACKVADFFPPRPA